MVSLIKKLGIFFKATNILKNWYFFPIMYLKLTSKPIITLKTKNGLKINLRSNSTDLMAFIHVWLIEEYSKHGFEIKETDLIIDVGAHIGLFTLYASQNCKNGLVYAFEPMPDNFTMLESNVMINNLQNIQLDNSAVSESSANMILYKNKDESGHSKFIQSENPISVPSKSLNDLFDKNNIKVCNLLKLDCEGAEYEIIDSLDVKNFKLIEKIIIEYHMADTHPELLENLKNKLKSNSFEISIEPLFQDIGFLYAKKV
jgi:FkbM family methyltransferase